ncbi:MAG TPA: histone deacetylase family protein [Burkholderiaceae bacterium]|nr:histone deacetylase family protein [Burkholderiaceae bacterium]
MHVFYSDRHRAHRGRYEFFRGELVPCFETPERADIVLAATRSQGIGPVLEPAPFDLARIERVHAPRYVRFLEQAWTRWNALGHTKDALPAVWPIRGMRHDIEPDDFIAQLGLYSFDSGTPFTTGTWIAARTGADIALTAARHVATGQGHSAFALTRPPGHHAGADFMGGYCFLNNAAIAAQALLDGGAQRIALLDVDYHHGNGTQAIFYRRADVLFLSIHGDPKTEYPFYLGHADERGAGPGAGFNVNYPLPAGCDNSRWFDALEDASKRIAEYRADALVVSLGVDTFAGDPISKFKLEAPEFRRLGERLARLALPTVFVLEGGYAVSEIGDNVAHVLGSFDGAAPA